jgi:hypothetical protein
MLLTLALSLLIAQPVRPARAGERVLLPIKLHVVREGAAKVVTDAFLEQELARANEIYAPYGVAFAVVESVELPAEHAALDTREQRDALGAYVQRGAIDCFVVRALRDVDAPERMRRGVHWHVRSRQGTPHFVILSSIAGADVLAHELGHYLGNPKHSETPGNLLSYTRSPDALPFLDTNQVRRVHAAIRGYLKRGELAEEKVLNRQGAEDAIGKKN